MRRGVSVCGARPIASSVVSVRARSGRPALQQRLLLDRGEWAHGGEQHHGSAVAVSSTAKPAENSFAREIILEGRHGGRAIERRFRQLEIGVMTSEIQARPAIAATSAARASHRSNIRQ